MERHFTALIVKSGDWYAGTVKELSGVHTQGKSIEEVKENLKEAIEMVIESNIRHFRELAQHHDYIEEDIVLAL
ncbi:MAG: type II toxin-antitoxin system HicB family antitoxin [Desulfococcaceae bacterium]|jgi:predicted RNase H-like HicB family nuclease|nr:type II toxin-antitoxin system HicB family antitoxin [Desulfococcaceae bacterium]